MSSERATIEAKDLQRAVAWAARALPRRPPVPVLGGLSLTVAGGQLVAAGYDYDAHATAAVPAGGEILPVLVPGAVLAPIVARTTGTVTLTVDDGARLVVASGRDRWRVMTMPNEDYPTLPPMPTKWAGAGGLADALAAVVGAASRDESLPVLTGVHVHAEGNQLRLACTDRYQMARRVLPWAGPEMDVVADAARLTGLASHLAGPPSLAVDEHHLAITDGTCAASVRLVDIEFPRLAKLLEPTDVATAAAVDVDRDDLLQAVASASLTATVANSRRLIDLQFEAGQLAVTSRDGVSGDAHSEVPLQLVGGAVPELLTVNEGYLTGALKALPSDVVRIYPGAAKSRGRAMLLCPVRSGGPDHDDIHAIMPIRKPGT